MGESACLLQQQQPFCYASGISNEANESNLIQAFGQSISFGRFGPESLAWEKWSSFSHNRYVEEAERYSRPGSVAEKKAFFEAHYKKLAAQKAAALLEQANNAASNSVTNQEHDDTANQATSPTSEAVHNKEQEVEVVSFVPNAILSNSSSYSHSDIPDINRVEECQPLVTTSLKVESHNKLEDVHTQTDASEKLSGNCEDEVLAPTSTKKPPASSLKSIKSTETSKLNLTSPKPISDRKENIMGTPVSSKKPALSSVDKNKSAIISTPFSSVDKRGSTINFTPTSLDDRKRSTINFTPISLDDRKRSTINSTSIGSVDKTRSTFNSTPISTVDKMRSTINFTPIGTVDKKRSAVNFTPIRELNRLTASVMRKFESARVGNASSKVSKDSSTPLRTPTMASKNQSQKPPALTPLTEKRRAKIPVGSLPSGSSNTAGPKWLLPSTENKLRYPIISSPFSLRTEERAARRKKKLEEKFNADEAQKVQLHTKLKEKAETEIRRIRQSFCFKARPLPDFYKERKELKNETDQCQLTHPKSPKQGKKSTPGRLWCKSSATPQKSTMKSNGTKNHLETNGQSSNPHLTSNYNIIRQENASPNIQYGNQNEFTQLIEQGINRRCRRTWHKI